MPRHYDWTTNDKEGRYLRKAITKAMNLLESSQNPHEVASLLNAISSASKAKRDLIDNEEIKQLRQEVAELKQLAALAAKTVATR